MPPKRNLADLRVLIVDDQPEMRTLVRDTLTEMGVIYMAEAANGQEALPFLGRNSNLVNFIICDWNMPLISGLDFLKKVRESHPDLPFLMLTSRTDQDSVLSAVTEGVSAYIRKPFLPEQLEEKMRFLMTKLPVEKAG